MKVVSGTCYIIQRSPRIDVKNDLVLDEEGEFTPLMDMFGKVEYIFDHIGAQGYKADAARDMIFEVFDAGKGFSDGDAVLAIGAPFLIGAAISIASMMNAKVTVLEWDRFLSNRGAYRLQVLDLTAEDDTN